MDVPKIGVKSKLYLLDCMPTTMRDPSLICDLQHSSWQHWILNPLSEARDETDIVMNTSQVCNPLSHTRNSLLFLFFFLLRRRGRNYLLRWAWMLVQIYASQSKYITDLVIENLSIWSLLKQSLHCQYLSYFFYSLSNLRKIERTYIRHD